MHVRLVSLAPSTRRLHALVLQAELHGIAVAAAGNHTRSLVTFRVPDMTAAAAPTAAPTTVNQTNCTRPVRSKKSRSSRRALLMPQVNTGSLYRGGKRT